MTESFAHPYPNQQTFNQADVVLIEGEVVPKYMEVVDNYHPQMLSSSLQEIVKQKINKDARESQTEAKIMRDQEVQVELIKAS